MLIDLSQTTVIIIRLPLKKNEKKKTPQGVGMWHIFLYLSLIYKRCEKLSLVRMKFTYAILEVHVLLCCLTLVFF